MRPFIKTLLELSYCLSSSPCLDDVQRVCAILTSLVPVFVFERVRLPWPTVFFFFRFFHDDFISSLGGKHQVAKRSWQCLMNAQHSFCEYDLFGLDFNGSLSSFLCEVDFHGSLSRFFSISFIVNPTIFSLLP